LAVFETLQQLVSCNVSTTGLLNGISVIPIFLKNMLKIEFGKQIFERTKISCFPNLAISNSVLVAFA
jgi:hypothetical protein